MFRVQEGFNAVLCANNQDVSQPVISIITCSSGIEVDVSAEKADQYSKTYSGIDVAAELRKLNQWSIDSPQNRKTPTGMTKFINAWMSRAQNSGGRPAVSSFSRPNQYQGDGFTNKADAARELMGMTIVKNTENEVRAANE